MLNFRVVLIAAISLLTACGGCLGGDDADAEYNCTVELLEESGKPGELFGLRTSEFGSDRSWGVLTYEDTQVFALGSYESESDPSLRAILLPFHPNGIEGGTYTLRFEDAEHTCHPVEVKVEAVEPEPGVWRRQAEQTPEFVEKAAARFGYTTEEVQAMVSADGFREGLSPAEFALAESQWVVDHPDNPYSLVNILNGDLDPEIERELDGIFAGLPENYVSDYDPSEYGPVTVVERTGDDKLEPIVGLSQHVPTRTDIGSAGQLQEKMAESRFWCAQADNAVSNKVLPALGVFSFGNPAAQAVWLLVQMLGWAYAKLGALMCGTLPVAITSFVVTSGPLEILEDKPLPTAVTGEMIATAISGPPVNLVVSGAEAALFATQFADVAAEGTKLQKALKETDALTTTPKSEWVNDYTNNLASANTGLTIVPELGGYDVTVGGHSFEGISGFNNKQWTNERPQTGNVASVMCGDSFCFQQIAIGRGPIVFFPKPDVFVQDSPMPEASIQANVRKIKIRLRNPTYLVAETGEFKQYYEVEDATDPTLDWFADSPAIVLPLAQTSSEMGEYSFTVEDLDLLPATGFVQSASENALGLRRTAFYVDTGDIKIIDAPGCLEPDQSYEVIAVRSNVGESYPIEWEATLGDIDSDGLYTASSLGEVEVTASIDIAGNIREDSRTFVVREDCRCESSFTTAGGLALYGRERFGVTSNYLASTQELFSGPGTASLSLSFPTQDVDIQILFEMPYSFGDVNGVWEIGQWTMTRDGQYAGGGDTGTMLLKYDPEDNHTITYDGQMFGTFGSDPEIAGTLEIEAETFDPENSFGPMVTVLCSSESLYEDWADGE